MLFAFWAVGVLSLVVVAFGLLSLRHRLRLMRGRSEVKARIRREVKREFEAELERSNGVGKVWVILKREMTIWRRATSVIYGKSV